MISSWSAVARKSPDFYLNAKWLSSALSTVQAGRHPKEGMEGEGILQDNLDSSRVIMKMMLIMMKRGWKPGQLGDNPRHLIQIKDFDDDDND